MNELPKLPRIPHRLFKWYCRGDRYEELHGDIEEFYYERYEELGPNKARLLYFLDIIRGFQSYAWKTNSNRRTTQFIMVKNNFKIAYRSLLRDKGYAGINILGLAIGIAFSTMLLIYLNNELSYDSMFANSDKTFRMTVLDSRIPENTRTFGQAPPALAPALKKDFPEIAKTTRLFIPQGQVVFSVGDRNFSERQWFTADPNVFEVFDFDFSAGDPSTALSEPNTLVVTQRSARKYFGDDDPMGKTIEGFGSTWEVTGVIESVPSNSHLHFDLILSNLSSDERQNQYLESWEAFGAYTYAVLENRGDVEPLNAKMKAFGEQYLGERAEVFGFGFQSIQEIYFGSSDIEYGAEFSHGEKSYVYIFSLMAIFLLVIACVNYVNLATSKAMYRGKEIGIRKAIGAYRNQLMMQFMTESFLITMIAMLVALGMLDIIFPYFNRITGMSFDLNLDTLQGYGIYLFGLSMIITIAAGSYPALYLAALKPTDTLKGVDNSRNSSTLLRKGLVTVQFGLTIVMIVSTLIVGRQLNFIDSKDMGFNKDRLLVIDINSGNVRRQFQAMKNEFQNIPGVESVGVSSRVPGEWKNIAQTYVFTDYSESGGTDSTRIYFMGFDDGMMETFQMRMIEGSSFESNQGNDSTKIIINQTAIKALQLENPLGALIQIRTRDGLFNAKIAGIIEDFHFQSLHEEIAPIIIGAWNNPVQSIDYFTLKVSGDMQQVINSADEVHSKFDEHTPMEFHFLSDQLDIFYEKEARAGMIFKMGAGLSIFVACMGLFGLASFTVQKRQKELGVRKILGAGRVNLFLLLTSSFTKQILLAFVIASPMAYVLMSGWLDVFQYRISIGAGVFLAAGIAAVVITIITISYHALSAIRSNPVDTLRSE